MKKTQSDKTGGFEDFGEFLDAVKRVHIDSQSDGRIDDLRAKVMTIGTDSSGGVLVPEQFAEEIFAHAIEESVVMSKAFIQPMKTDKVNMPRLRDADRSSNMFGGVSFNWLTETADRSTNEASPAVAELELEANNGVATAYVSNNLIADAYDFAAFFRYAFGKTVGFYVDAAAFNGTGNGQPLGVIPSGAAIAVSRSSANKVDMVDLKNLAKRFSPSGWRRGDLFINQEVIPQFFELQSEAANSVSVVNLMTRKFFGIDVVPTEYIPALGTKGDVVLADFSQYVIGKRSLVISASGHVPDYFQANKTLWKIEVRIDGQPAVDAAYTPYKGSSTVSPFIVLDDPTG